MQDRAINKYNAEANMFKTLIGAQSDIPLPNIPLHDIAANGILVALVVIFAWRYYEYQREKKALARLLEQKAQYEEDSPEDTQAR